MDRERVQDLVCGMRFLREETPATTGWEGITYYFCCEACRAAFEADPLRFLRRKEEKLDDRA